MEVLVDRDLQPGLHAEDSSDEFYFKARCRSKIPFVWRGCRSKNVVDVRAKLAIRRGRGRPPIVRHLAGRAERGIRRRKGAVTKRELARKLGASETSTWRALKMLESRGHVRRRFFLGWYASDREVDVLEAWRRRGSKRALGRELTEALRRPGPERWSRIRPLAAAAEIERIARVRWMPGRRRGINVPRLVEILAQSLRPPPEPGSAEARYDELARSLGDYEIRKALREKDTQKRK